MCCRFSCPLECKYFTWTLKLALVRVGGFLYLLLVFLFQEQDWDIGSAFVANAASNMKLKSLKNRSIRISRENSSNEATGSQVHKHTVTKCSHSITIPWGYRLIKTQTAVVNLLLIQFAATDPDSVQGVSLRSPQHWRNEEGGISGRWVCLHTWALWITLLITNYCHCFNEAHPSDSRFGKWSYNSHVTEELLKRDTKPNKRIWTTLTLNVLVRVLQCRAFRCLIEVSTARPWTCLQKPSAVITATTGELTCALFTPAPLDRPVLSSLSLCPGSMETGLTVTCFWSSTCLPSQTLACPFSWLLIGRWDTSVRAVHWWG